VLKVSESRKADHEYWKALNAEIENGGVEAMMQDLLSLDLTDFNVRIRPNTNALLEQKLQSLGPIQRWWHDRLHSGSLANEFDHGAITNVNFSPEDTGWCDFIGTLDAIQGVINVSGGRFYKKPSAIDMARALKEMCPSAQQIQGTIDKKRKRGFILPNLAQARADFDAYIGGKVQWPEVTE
jgi:hypothetical protein